MNEQLERQQDRLKSLQRIKPACTLLNMSNLEARREVMRLAQVDQYSQLTDADAMLVRQLEQIYGYSIGTIARHAYQHWPCK